MFSAVYPLAASVTLTLATNVATLESQPSGPIPPAPQGRIIRGVINITAGATGGTYTLACYQGVGLSGTQVGSTMSQTFAASATLEVPFMFIDTTATAPVTGVYTIGVTSAGAAGTANVVGSYIEIFVSDPAGAEV